MKCGAESDSEPVTGLSWQPAPDQLSFAWFTDVTLQDSSSSDEGPTYVDIN